LNAKAITLSALAVIGCGMISALWWLKGEAAASTALAGIGASILAAVVFDIVPRLSNYVIRREAEWFFGEAFATGRGRLIAAQWMPHNILDSVDLQGLVDVAQEINARFGQSPIISTDHAAPMIDQTASFVTFGLGMNRYANMVADETKDEYFTWYGRPGEDRTDISWKNPVDETWNTKKATADEDFAFIVRLMPSRHPGTVWLLCGGARNWGTAEAGWYLANRWRNLLRQWRKSSPIRGRVPDDFVCWVVLRAKPGQRGSGVPIEWGVRPVS
jgi:hypothetical protein